MKKQFLINLRQAPGISDLQKMAIFAAIEAIRIDKHFQTVYGTLVTEELEMMKDAIATWE